MTQTVHCGPLANELARRNSLFRLKNLQENYLLARLSGVFFWLNEITREVSDLQDQTEFLHYDENDLEE